MKKKTILSILMICCMTLGLLTGCGADESKEPEESVTEETKEPEVTEEKENFEEADATEILAEISDKEFWLGSGAGAWCTVLRVREDGTFTGNYHDSDMGDSAEEYPNGTCYWCDFSGKFTELKKVNEYTWSTGIDYIEVVYEPKTEEIVDGIRYIYSEPYGLDNAAEILFYEQGAPLEELPESFLNWVSLSNEEEDALLPFCGLYNVNAEEGFSSYVAENEPEPEQKPEEEEEKEPEEEAEKEPEEQTEEEPTGVDAELKALKEQAEALEKRLEEDGSLSQGEMNEISAELYKLWDYKLNELWGRIKKFLDKDAMTELTKEERVWIDYKKAEIQKVVEKYDGGSIAPLLANRKGAELTEERVYVLSEYLR